MAQANTASVFAKAVRVLLPALFLLSFCSCNANSPKNQFRFAEKLFSEKKYEASIHEFEKIVQRDPQGEHGVLALQQIALIQQLYLNQPDEAAKTYKLVLKRATDPTVLRDTMRTVADIYFERFEDFGKAVEHYQIFLNTYPEDENADEVLFRMGRANFLRSRFKEAMEAYQSLRQRYPKSKLALRSDLEVANCIAAMGNCKEALKLYDTVIASGDREVKPMAMFEAATCYEHMDDLDKAYELLDEIQLSYPNPGVVTLKMQKIKRRKILRRR